MLRDGWSPNATWALVDGGPHGSLNCGHAHADALALEVATQRPTGADRQRHVQLHGSGARALPGVVVAQHGDGRRRELVADRRAVPLASRRADDGARVAVVAAARTSGAARTTASRGWPIRRFTSGACSWCTDAISSCSTRSTASGAHEFTVHWHCAPDLAFAPRGDARRRDRASGAHRRWPAPALRVGRRTAGDRDVVAIGGVRGEAGGRARAHHARRPAGGSASVPCSSRARRMPRLDERPMAARSRRCVGARFVDRIVWRGSPATIEAAGSTERRGVRSWRRGAPMARRIGSICSARRTPRAQGWSAR